jgi:hypothetical protein
MKVITVKDAARKLNMTDLTVRCLMQQEKLPIGYALKREGCTQYHYIIYEELLDSFVKKVESGDVCITQKE